MPLPSDERIALLEKVVAVHLAECSGAHKAVDLKVSQLEVILNKHVSQTAANTTRILKLLYIGFALIAILTFLGPQEAMKLLLSFVRP